MNYQSISSEHTAAVEAVETKYRAALARAEESGDTRAWDTAYSQQRAELLLVAERFEILWAALEAADMLISDEEHQANPDWLGEPWRAISMANANRPPVDPLGNPDVSPED